jgi:hypothetical protein
MNISAEGRLLLNCARIRIDAAAQEQIDIAVRQNPDWGYLRRAADKNRVLPLVYNGLMQSCASSVPVGVLHEWRGIVDENLARQEKNQAVLLEAMAMLEGAGIPCVPFKGITFALFVYGSLALRHAGDVDLLVRPADFIRARDLLIRSGYSQYYFGHAEVSTVQGSLVDLKKRISIDLHYALTPYYQHTNMDQAKRGSRLARRKANRLDTDSTHWFFSLDCEPLWGRLGSVTVAGRAMPIFSPEDLLMVAVINGIKENWRMLVRVSDIADLVRTHDMDWDRVFGQVRAMRCGRKFNFGLLLARELCGMPLPQEIVGRISATPTSRSLALQTQERFCRDERDADEEEFRLLCAFYTMDRVSDRAWYFVYILRRLKQFSFRMPQYVSFARGFARQLWIWLVHAR